MSNNITNAVIFLKQSTLNEPCKKEFPVRRMDATYVSAHGLLNSDSSFRSVAHWRLFNYGLAHYGASQPYDGSMLTHYPDTSQALLCSSSR
ncbi:hypothetical protein DFO56_101197 [Kosakonia sp. AG348]|nr:hypothetical protein DFO56_101197 [Kosakonia sp. AG348]